MREFINTALDEEALEAFDALFRDINEVRLFFNTTNQPELCTTTYWGRDSRDWAQYHQ